MQQKTENGNKMAVSQPKKPDENEWNPVRKPQDGICGFNYNTNNNNDSSKFERDKSRRIRAYVKTETVYNTIGILCRSYQGASVFSPTGENILAAFWFGQMGPAIVAYASFRAAFFVAYRG